jgi:hypothetical protein
MQPYSRRGHKSFSLDKKSGNRGHQACPFQNHACGEGIWEDKVSVERLCFDRFACISSCSCISAVRIIAFYNMTFRAFVEPVITMAQRRLRAPS